MTAAVQQVPERRILVVDDEADLVEELIGALLAADWEADGASNGAEALDRLAKDETITVLLTDIRMPGMNGLELARRVCETRDDSQAVSVVILTGHGTLNEATEAIRVGAFDFLSKPVGLKALLDVAERAFQAARERRMKEAARVTEVAHLRAERETLREELAKLGDRNEFNDTIPSGFSSILSHELRTPLTALMGVPEILGEAHNLSSEEVRENLDIVRSAGARLTQIADDFVEFVAPPDPRSLAIRPVAPEMVLRRVIVAQNAAAVASQVNLITNDTAAGVVETDPAMLAKALGRLVANAIAWAPANTEVSVTTAPEGDDQVIFAVTDRGPGMDAKQLDIARQPFRQLDMSLSRKVGGLGLGIPLAERMAHRLGGRLRIQTAPGQGTQAAIVLPRRATRRLAKPGPTPPANEGPA